MPVVSKQQQEPIININTASPFKASFQVPTKNQCNNKVHYHNQQQQNFVPIPSMKEIKAHLEEMFAQAAGKHNLHSEVLHNFIKTTFVPHPTKNSKFNFNDQFTNEMPISEQQELRNPKGLPTKCVFVGQLPLVIKAGEIAWFFFVVLGSLPVSVSPVTHSASTNANGKVTSIMYKVELFTEHVQPAIARLNGRLFPDQTGYHLAKDQQEARLMRQYQKMLERNPTIRFNHRPRSPITVVEEKDSTTNTNNTSAPFNPMCDCSACQDFMNQNVNYDFLENVYIPQVTGTCDKQLQNGFFKFINSADDTTTNNMVDSNHLAYILDNYTQTHAFNRAHMVRCHGFLSKQHDLTTARDKKAYSSVCETALVACQEWSVRYWPFWKYAEHETDSKDLNCSRARV